LVATKQVTTAGTVFVPIADRLYGEHVSQLKRESEETQTRTPEQTSHSMAAAIHKRWAAKRAKQQRGQARKKSGEEKRDG
jgi:hypothetical protein